MPENSTMDREQEQLAKFSMQYERRDVSLEIESDEELKDIGELLGFRITGGRDFFMPITIFHVNPV